MKLQLKIICFLCCLQSVTAQKLTIKSLGDSTFQYTTSQSYNNQLVSANGVFQLTKVGAVLIDTPWDTTQFQPLLDSINLRFHQKVCLIIVTHAHEDRTAGLYYYKKQGIPSYSSFGTYQICQEMHFPIASNYFVSDTVFQIGNTKIETCFPGAGHSSDNIVVYLPQDRILIGGCFIKSCSATNLGNLSDANLGMWGIALHHVKSTYRKARIVVPGHDTGTSTKAINHSIRLIKRFKRS